MSGNRAFKQIANNLSGSDYIKNKKSKEIYKTYRGSPDKINKNVRIEENSLASAESYEILNLITNGKDITYTMSGGEGTSAISLQNLYSSSDTWKGSLLKSEDGKVDPVAQSFNEPLFLQSIYGTNGTVGCVTEDTSQLSLTCCGTAGTASYPQSVPKPSLTGKSFSPMDIHPGSSEYNDFSLGEVYNDASYYEYTAYPDFGISVSTDVDNVLVALSSQVAIASTFTVTVTPFNKCRESGTNTSKSFQVTATPPIPTPTTVDIESPIYVTPGSSVYSTVKLSDVFNYATSYEYQQYNTDDNNITITTGPDTRIKVEWPSGPVLGDNVTISVDVTASNITGTGAATKSFTVKPILPPIPTPTSVAIESPIYVTPGSSAYSTVKLSDVFNNATSYVYYVHNADGNNINISTEPDTTIKVEWPSGPVLGDNVTITVDVTANNVSGTGATKSFTVKPALPSVSSTNAIKTEVTSNTDNKNYVLYTFGYSAFSIDVSAMPEVTGTISIDFSGTTINTLNSNVLLVAGGGAGGLMQTGLYSNGSVKNGSGGGGAGGYASGQMAITNTNNSTTTYSIGVGNGGKGLKDGSYSTNGNGVQGRDSSITLDGVSLIKVIGGGSGLYTHTNGVGSGGSTGGNSHDVQLKPVETSISTITGYGNLGGELEFGNMGEPALERGGGGGGGAGGAGTSGINEPGTDTATRGGNGGIGKEWEINNTFYGGGGGGTGAENNIIRVGQGGSGGGGTTNTIGNDTGDYNGTAGLGGGGAGGWHSSLYRGDGGSGVCIIAFEKGTISY